MTPPPVERYGPAHRIPHETVRNINGYRFGPDDLVLGFDTSYVTARTLARLPRGFLNWHTGQAIEPEDADPARLRSQLLIDAAPALAGSTDTVRSHGFAAIPRIPQQDGRYYTTPTWREWRAYRTRARRTSARR